MKLSHLLLLAATLTTYASCATLRQYSRDWLIAGETSLHKEPKRITAKSVFIAPDFSAVRCSQGYREDENGNCVKLVRVSQTAQLDFLLQKLNAMYGSSEGPSPLPFGGPSPVKDTSENSPFGLVKPLIGNSGQDTSNSHASVGLSPVKGDHINIGAGDKPPKAEPCIELPISEAQTTSTSSQTQTTVPPKSSTTLSSAETLSVSASVQIVASTSELPSSSEVSVVDTTVGDIAKDPEVVLVDNDSDLLASVSKVNGSSVEEKVQIPVVDGNATTTISEGDNLLVEVNGQAIVNVGDVVHTIKEDESVESSTEDKKVETSTKVLVPESVPVNTLDKDIAVDVAEKFTTTLTPESSTIVDDVDETSTEDYGDEIIVEPEMGSGQQEDIKEVENVSDEKLFSETVNANLDAMIELNNSSQVDKVLPVRNIIPEASSERIQFLDSPIINIQPVRNTFPKDDEVLEVDLKPNDNIKGASLQVHNLNPSKLIPPKFMEEPIKQIPDTPFSLEDYINRQPVPPIPVYRPYENHNFNPQQQHFPLNFQQPQFPPRNGFVRFPNEREQVYQVDQRVNSVRFPPGEPFNDDKLRQWPNNWRPDNRRVQRPAPAPVMRFWNKMPLIRDVQEPNQRFQQERRRPPPQYYQ